MWIFAFPFNCGCKKESVYIIRTFTVRVIENVSNYDATLYWDYTRKKYVCKPLVAMLLRICYMHWIRKNESTHMNFFAYIFIYFPFRTAYQHSMIVIVIVIVWNEQHNNLFSLWKFLNLHRNICILWQLKLTLFWQQENLTNWISIKMKLKTPTATDRNRKTQRIKSTTVTFAGGYLFVVWIAWNQSSHR